ncbi:MULTISPECIES: phage holin family protein [Streptacidiphilus]|uniref:Phage holin family protein n=2 Tax=Streptacidiphilus TaxID=228398 RepID=A0ABV6UH93_9ACTN|nr:phage holin family protein [Streptacidiphilus jeojiense]
MIKHGVVSLLVLAATFLLCGWLLPGMTLQGGLLGVLWTTVLFAVVNLVLGGFLRTVARPLVWITFGLFLFVINAITLKVTALVTSDLQIHGLGTALWAALIMSVVGVAVRLVRRHTARSPQQGPAEA